MADNTEDDWEIIEDSIFTSFVNEHFGDVPEPEHKKTRTRHHLKIDYWKTSLGELILSEDVNDATSYNGKLFKRRFRVPFGLFTDHLVPMCRERNIFDTKDSDRIRILLN